MKIKKIILVNNIADFDAKNMHLAKNGEFHKDEVLHIALSPNIYSYLNGKGVFVHPTDPYFTNESHKKALKQSRVLIDWLRERAPFTDLGLGIERAYQDLYIFWMRLSVHYFLWVTEVVCNAVVMHKPEVLAAPLLGKRIIASLAVRPEDRYVGYIVQEVARKNELLFEDISGKMPDRNGIFLSRSVEYLSHLVRFILKHIRFQFWKLAVYIDNKREKERAIFFTTKHYQIAKVAKEMQQQIPGWKFHLFEGPVLSYVRIPAFVVALLEPRFFRKVLHQRELLKDFASSIASEKNLFSLNGISFSEILADKAIINIMDHITSFYVWSLKLDHCLDILKPGAFISNGNRSDDIMLAELCSKRGIPTILISHGSHVCPKDEYERIEWSEHGRSFLRAPFSFLALQTPLSEEFLTLFPSQSKVLRTGPLTWGRAVDREASARLFEKMFRPKYDREDVKVIVHAGSPKLSTNMRLYVYETPDEYLRALSDLTDAVNNVPDCLLIIRFRPSIEIEINDLRKRIPFSEKIVLSTEEPFIDVLGMADLLVSFSSTTIEEALQNRIPVLLYGGGGRYQHIQACGVKLNDTVLPKAIYHAEKCDDLEYAVSKILDLKINNGEYSYLFEPYIYPEGARISLGEALKANLKKKKG